MNYSKINIEPRSSTRPIIPPRPNVNEKVTMFGIVIGDRNKGTRKALDALYADFVPREVGLLKTIDLLNKNTDSLSNPAAYLLEKNQDIENIGKELAEVYKKAYTKKYNTGATMEVSKNYAQKYTDEFKKIRYEKHNQDFPPKFVEEAINKLRLRNSQGGLVF
jgi:hypothetical protein